MGCIREYVRVNVGRRSDPRRRVRQQMSRRAVCVRREKNARRQFFLLLGLWPAGVFPVANGLTGVMPPFLRFLSAFGFFFSLLLRI